MATSNRERVGRALDLLRDGLGPYVLRQCLAKLPQPQGLAVAKDIEGEVDKKDLADLGKLVPHVDLQKLLYAMTDRWREVFHDQLGHPGRSLLSELRDVRNDHAHSKPFNLADAHRAIDSATRLLEAVSAPQAEETRALATELLRLKFEAETARAVKKTAEQTPAAAVKGLTPWREVVQPHPDVQKGRYAQAEFAADLWQVHTGLGDDEYRDPKERRSTIRSLSLQSVKLPCWHRLVGFAPTGRGSFRALPWGLRRVAALRVASPRLYALALSGPRGPTRR